MEPTPASKIIDALMSTAQPGEWQSITINITGGVKEAPMINANILPGTTKENAIRIQNGLVEAFKQLNKGK